MRVRTMKKYGSQKEFEAEIKDGFFYSKESIDITGFTLRVAASIRVEGDITAQCISAHNINARIINARFIDAWDITAWDVNAKVINARNLYTGETYYYTTRKVSDIKKLFMAEGKTLPNVLC